MRQNITVAFFVAFFCLPATVLQSQTNNLRLETGITGGPVFFFGDIGSMGTGTHSGISVSYRWFENFSLQVSAAYAQFSDSDEGTQNSARDYAFTTTIIEPEISVIYTFFTQRGRGYTRKGLLKQWDKWSGFVFGGVAFPVFKVTPARHFTSDNMDRDHGVAPALSAGAALQYGINEHLYLRLTLNPHFIFSDYLDGYTSVNSSSYDIYHKVSVGIYYRFHLSE